MYGAARTAARETLQELDDHGIDKNCLVYSSETSLVSSLGALEDGSLGRDFARWKSYNEWKAATSYKDVQ